MSWIFKNLPYGFSINKKKKLTIWAIFSKNNSFCEIYSRKTPHFPSCFPEKLLTFWSFFNKNNSKINERRSILTFPLPKYINEINARLIQSAFFLRQTLFAKYLSFYWTIRLKVKKSKAFGKVIFKRRPHYVFTPPYIKIFLLISSNPLIWPPIFNVFLLTFSYYYYYLY